ncbi:protein kinase domain-containing protein [Sorangium sp. So ce394]|uniref:serine/threonine-protein kinase n=1 Tax=Sorangium sp. So ce394 TaxID=3133310 RepID=UPI003F5C8B76
MSETIFLGPDASNPCARARWEWLSPRLPPDLEEEAVRRIAWVALFTIVAGAAGFIVSELFPGVALGPRPIRFAVFLPFVLVSAALFVVARRRLLSPPRIVDLSFAYKVLGAASISVITNAQPWPEGPMLPGWPPVAVWVLVFPIIIPAPSVRTLLTSTLAILTDPACLWVLVRWGFMEMPAREAMFRRFFPSVIALALSVFVSRVVFGLGRKLDAARELGSYRLVERLGGGGMGEVWRARHRMLARPAAVKLIRPEAFQGEAASGGNAKARFEREAQATAALRSPHTIGIFDFGVARDGSFYYVMELLDGMDLDTLVKLDGPQPPARVVHLLRQACHSLHEAHRAFLVHRDIKPANLFLCRYGADLDFLKVLDFGLVAVRKKDAAPSTLTADNAITGTPAFMAPEVVVGDRPIDGRTDIYALGCVAYWLLTGALVFEAETAMKMVLLHATEAPVAPSKRAGRPIPPALDRLVLDCLEKDPAKRPQSARELSERLAALRLDAEWTEQHAAAWWESVAPPSLTGRAAKATLDALG